ncbi:YqiA/YcfP family alpha/beta fold hydrolase [Chitinivorax sp. B]|uniref:YqiA/YcfP family alpha/beta fold hydrolase n=1 Tax=Chitinivorax sp. B TaxID=2502235 RepID=UPI0010F8AB57|nr:YqiA/YcfP family alpha/beta fold hydrolase [Chitinivorax sp. B]
MIVYLHGFMSGPSSHKASQLRQFMSDRGKADQFICPKLSPYPAQAITQLENLLSNFVDPPCLIGSSLGGYYALNLAEKFNCKAVLVNPAIRPYEDLNRFLGPQISPYTGEAFTLTTAHINELKAMEVMQPTRLDRYWLMVQTGDEVLDYRLAVERLYGARLTIEERGDHSFQGFERFLTSIEAFSIQSG